MIKSLVLMRVANSMKIEITIVFIVLVFITLMPFIAMMGLTQVGLNAALTSILAPSSHITFPPSTNAGQKIDQEALTLAHKTRGWGINLKDATYAYQQARLITHANPQFNGASDCGEFVAVVVRMVYDHNYPMRGTGLQLQYLKTHPTLWQQIPMNTPIPLLKPGDIFVNSLHTYIYTGMQANGYNTVAASWGGYIPEPSNLFYYENGVPFYIFRAV